MMEYAIGIDSGGTSYRLRAVASDGSVLAEYIGRSANHYRLSHDELVAVVNESLDALLEAFGGRRDGCKALFCGTTGLDSSQDLVLLNDLYLKYAHLSCPVRIISDAELAHYAVTGGKGMTLVAGTGCIIFGTRKDGRSGRAGGWLFSILGDEGGGAWVSRKALQFLSRYFDGALEDSLLLKSVRKELGIEGRDELCDAARSIALPPMKVPSLGRIVSETADAGDRYAVMILEEAAEKAFSLVLDLDSSLDLSHDWPDFPVGLWGSTILGSEVMHRSFSALLKSSYPEARIVLPSRSALDAASEQALKLWLGV